MLRATTASRSVLQRRAAALTAPLSSQSAAWDYDVAIVGGGVVGAALACQLAQTPSLAGQRILVVESFAPPPLPAALAPGRPVDLRTYAMTPKSEEFLRDLGVWGPLENAGRTQPYAAMQVWSRGGNNGGHVVWDAANHSPARSSSKASSGTEPPKPHLGTIVEHTSLQSALYDRLQALHADGKLELRCPAQVKKAVFSAPPASHRQAPPAAVLHLEEPVVEPAAAASAVKTAAAAATISESKPAAAAAAGAAPAKKQSAVTCRLVVAADGAQSPLRKAAGLGTWGWSYGQRAVVATVDVGALGLQRSSANAGSSSSSGSEAPLVALQRFLPTGPVALLPLWEVPTNSSGGATTTISDGNSGSDCGKPTTTRLASVIWSTEPRHADALCAMPDEEFVAALNAALHDSNSSGSSASSQDTGVGFGGWVTGDDQTSTANSRVPNFSTPGAGGGGGATAGGLVGLLQKAVEGPLGAFVVSSADKVARQGSATLSLAARNVLSPLVQAAERAGALTGENSQFEAAPQVVKLAPQSRRFAIDLNLQQAYAYADWRIALVGDAAHSVHPMAGQGLNLGLADAQALANALDATARAGADLGDPSPSGHLAAYARDRKQAALQLMTSLDMLHRLFGDAPAPATSASASSSSSTTAAFPATPATPPPPGAAPGAAEAVAVPGASAAGFGAMGAEPVHAHTSGRSSTSAAGIHGSGSITSNGSANRSATGNATGSATGNSSGSHHGSALAGKGGPTTVGALPWPVRRAAGDLREAGLATLNLLPPLKALLAKHAMGLK